MPTGGGGGKTTAAGGATRTTELRGVFDKQVKFVSRRHSSTKRGMEQETAFPFDFFPGDTVTLGTKSV